MNVKKICYIITKYYRNVLTTFFCVPWFLYRVSLPVKYLLKRWTYGRVYKKHPAFQQLHGFTSLMSPLHSHVTNRGPADQQPCTFSALYISQRCSTEFHRHVWTNKTHFLQLLRGSQESDVSTSPDTAEALYNGASALRTYLTNANTPAFTHHC